MDIISGYYTTRTMQALFNVGFFDAMRQEGSVDVQSFADSRDLDVGVLQSLCDSLYALRILKRDGSGYCLDSKGEILVQVARGWFEGVYGYESVFHSLEALLTRDRMYGRDVHRRPDCVARGSGEMENWLYFPLAIDIIARNRYKNVLDLGCGEATFLRSLCASTDVTCYGIDMAPEAIAEGMEKVRQAGLADRIQLAVADITKLEKAPDHWPGIDIATCFFVLHEILFAGPEHIVAFLSSFRTLFPGIPLIVFEVTRATPQEMRSRPGMAIHYTLQHDLTHQKLIALEDWRELFRMAGFGSIEERYLGFARSVIFTLR
jgi:ubiquinone/menaquinone biosynthesis C-methylase UbiE